MKCSHAVEGNVCLCCVQGSVRALLHEKIRDAYTHPQFITDVMKPMQIESIIDQDVREAQGRLSAGKLSGRLTTHLPPVFARRCRTCLVVSCRESPSRCAWANRLTSTWSMSPRPTWTPSRDWWPPGSSRGDCASASLSFVSSSTAVFSVCLSSSILRWYNIKHRTLEQNHKNPKMKIGISKLPRGVGQNLFLNWFKFSF